MRKVFSEKTYFKKFNRLLTALIVGVIIFICSAPLGIEKQFNESGKSEFDIDFIISDEVFTNINSMTIEQIQAFLEAKNSPLADKELYQKYYLTYPTDMRIYNLVFPNGKLARESSPAEIIYYSSRIQITPEQKPNHVNPQVLLVLLELNQGLIENSAKLDQYTLDNALKFNSIEGKLYSLSDQGFLNQVIGLVSKLTYDFEYFKNASKENKPTTIIDGIIHYPNNAGTYALQKYLKLSKKLLDFCNLNISSTSSYPTAPSFRFPVENYKTSICFNWGGWKDTSRHVGEDVRCNSIGEVVRAVGNGIVKFASPWKSVCDGNWGDVIVIEHTLSNGSKICSIYGHININVAKGDQVKKGQIIGSIKDYTCTSGWTDHLHFGIYNGQYGNYTGYPDWLCGYLPSNNFPGNYLEPSNFIDTHQCFYETSDSSVRWHPDGTLIRASGQFEVYLIHDGKKKHITNGDFLNKYYYGFDWNNVIEVAPEELECFPTGEDIVYPPRLVTVTKPDGSKPVYLIFNETYKRHFTSPEVFRGLGYDWNDIINIPESELNNYPDDPVCPELYSPYPDGTLIRKYGDTNVYVITNSKKRWITTDIVFNMLGYNWNCIVDDTDLAVNNIPEITPPIDYNMIIQCGGINPDLKASTNPSGPWSTNVSGEQGTTFYFQGTGFTPNSTATQHIKYPDGTDHTSPIAVDSSGNLSWSYTSHCDTPTGTYTIWVVDVSGQSSNNVYETIEINPACLHTVSTPNTPSGPSSGETNVSYTYTTGGSSCSQGHNVEYRFDWGDGTYSSWSTSTSASHSWFTAGTYTVKAQARCSVDTSIVSDWSSGLTVTINLPPEIWRSPSSMTFEATEGGSNPSSQTLQVKNSGGGTLSYSISDNATWLSVSPTSGTSTGNTNNHTVSVNISGLSAGTYNATITITASGATNSPQTVQVNLTVYPPPTPGILSVTPADGLSSSGLEGGPFSPSSKTYTLQNTGGTSINWTASKTQNWVSLSSTGGSLSPGASTTVTVSINSNANNLPAGDYSDTVTFTNTTNGSGNTTREVTLKIKPQPPPSEPDINLPSISLSFGKKKIGKSYDLEFIIENKGTSELIINSITKISGDDVFLIVAFPSSILPGDSNTAIISFLPSERKIYNALFKINSNDPDEAEVEFQVSGEGIIGPIIEISKQKIYFGAVRNGVYTSSQTLLISNTGDETLNWQAKKTQDWIKITPQSGKDNSLITISINPSGLNVGTHAGEIIIEDLNNPNLSEKVEVILKVYESGQEKGPFGYFDTPIDSSVVSGNIPVSGWALDDIEVTRVEIKREPVAGDPPEAIGSDGLIYIGDGVFVKGARPDIENAYSTYPKSDRAGWGYMLLTNMLPNQGNGTFRIYAFAYDERGHRVELGRKTIHCDNKNRVKPFGTIDIPVQGGIASGTQYTNFGWALTPPPKEIPRDGSTIWVFIDGVSVGHPVYNQYRKDIAELFPQYLNSDGAVGYFYIDTTKYENGVHNIAWSVTDNQGEIDG
ncbi:choice-of-anchor D domain-containing protein, partial [Candidatus Aminicenantes bacterium AC-708-I09]|nr:choice-of-anchor D domain-containing protein [Candidatus Aminicenantes bacterium AC-708-I09]